MRLVGQSSGAVAEVKQIRLKADNSGTIIGSLFIPDPTLSSTPSFSTGTKTFSLTSSKTKSTIVGTKDSEAETTYTASGTLQNVENLTLRMRNADVERNTVTDSRTRRRRRTRTRVDKSLEIEPLFKEDGLIHWRNLLKFQMKMESLFLR